MTFNGRSSAPLDLGNVATAASPHTISSQSWYRSGAVVTGLINITLGSALGSGDISNVTVATIAGPLPMLNAGVPSAGTGPLLSGVLTTDGHLNIAATTGAVKAAGLAALADPAGAADWAGSRPSAFAAVGWASSASSFLSCCSDRTAAADFWTVC